MKKIKSPILIVVLLFSLIIVWYVTLVVALGHNIFKSNNDSSKMQEPHIIRLLTGNRYDSTKGNRGRSFPADCSGYFIVKTETDIVSNAIHVDALTHSLMRITENPNDDLSNWIKAVSKDNKAVLNFDPNTNHILYLYTADAVFRSIYIAWYPGHHTVLFFLCSPSAPKDNSQLIINYLTENQYTILVRGRGPADGFRTEYSYVLLQTNADVLSNIEHLRALNIRIFSSDSSEAENCFKEINPPFLTVDEIIKDPFFSHEVKNNVKNDSIVYRYYDDPKYKEVIVCYSPQTKTLLIINRNIWWE